MYTHEHVRRWLMLEDWKVGWLNFPFMIQVTTGGVSEPRKRSWFLDDNDEGLLGRGFSGFLKGRGRVEDQTEVDECNWINSGMALCSLCVVFF